MYIEPSLRSKSVNLASFLQPSNIAALRLTSSSNLRFSSSPSLELHTVNSSISFFASRARLKSSIVAGCLLMMLPSLSTIVNTSFTNLMFEYTLPPIIVVLLLVGPDGVLSFNNISITFVSLSTRDLKNSKLVFIFVIVYTVKFLSYK